MLGGDTRLDSFGDLDFSGGDMAMVVGLRQRISIVLRFVFKEWFQDESLGIPYFEEIWVKAPDLTRVTVIFRSAVLAVEGIDGILSFNVAFDTAARRLTISMTVSVDSSELDHTEVIEL